MNPSSALSTDYVAELLGPWGFDSINSLKNAIIETTDDLERAMKKGYSEIVAEEIEKLATMQQLLSDVSNTPRNVQPAFLSSSSQNEIAGAEVLPSLPSVRSKINLHPDHLCNIMSIIRSRII